MSERRTGFYWVKWENQGCEPSWAPTHWDEELCEWWVDNAYGDKSEVVEVGPRIPTPDEPWVSAPVQPTEEQAESAFWAWPHTDVNAVYSDMVSSAPEP